MRLTSRKLTGRTRLTRSCSPEFCEARHGFYVLLCISRLGQKFWQGSIEMASGQESWQQGTRMERMGENCKVWNQSSLWCMVNDVCTCCCPCGCNWKPVLLGGSWKEFQGGCRGSEWWYNKIIQEFDCAIWDLHPKAYEVLSSPEKRSMYDRGGKDVTVLQWARWRCCIVRLRFFHFLSNCKMINDGKQSMHS